MEVEIVEEVATGIIERVESGNLTACIADAEKIATAAESIIKNPSDIQNDIAQLEVIIATFKTAETDCDFGDVEMVVSNLKSKKQTHGGNGGNNNNNGGEWW